MKVYNIGYKLMEEQDKIHEQMLFWEERLYDAFNQNVLRYDE